MVPRYDEIRAMQVDRLLSFLSSGTSKMSKTVHKNFDEKIESYAAGELNHARDAISLVWESSRHPRNTDTTRATCHFDWGIHFVEQVMKRKQRQSVRASLINSIQGRSLLHQRYWARISRGGRLAPIYFPNAVPSSTFSRIAAREWRYISVSTSVLS